MNFTKNRPITTSKNGVKIAKKSPHGRRKNPNYLQNKTKPNMVIGMVLEIIVRTIEFVATKIEICACVDGMHD